MNGVMEETLCLKLKNVFKSLLEIMYINCQDIPNYSLTFIFDYRENDKNSYIIDCFDNIQKEKLSKVNILDLECRYESVRVHEFKNCIFWFLLKTGDGKKTLLRPLARNFFERMIRPLTNIFDHYFASESIFLSLLVSVECCHEEDVIISRAVLEFFHYLYGIDINFINSLSASTYEGRSVNSRIIIPQKGVGRGKKNKKSNLRIKLVDKLLFNNNEIRKIRKLLEIATPPYNLLIGKDNEILGFVCDGRRHFECEIHLMGYLKWELFFDNKCINYCNGVFRIPTETQFIDQMKCLKKVGISVEQFEKIQILIKEAMNQEHGTILIISQTENIISEIKRLCQFNRGLQIRKLNLYENKTVINNLTSIDGALFIDFDCNCYGIGIILDGDAVVNGSTSRGARFNSAINYIERQKQQKRDFASVIISEDKTIDVYSN